ncbi:MAG: hypothetical protein KIT84_28715 [Labilithrix sp.]|nr:hypothetical protein [Labilithrix sp.]MCW5815043.1 hypothetical protein [Labilithrix sp.]
MTNVPGPVFTQKETIDKPGIVGARWWQESIATEVPRRKALKGLLALGGVLGAMALIGTCASRAFKGGSLSPFSSKPDFEFANKSALEMQKEFGWSFGATGDPLVFDGTSTAPFDRAALDRVDKDLAPANAAHAPWFVPTLFQSPGAMPKSKPTGDPDAPPFKPLKDVIVPVMTSPMQIAFEQGRALAALLAVAPKAKDLAVVVDLPGTSAVAFAAGAAGILDPVFLFDNWPHPRGVVPAHLTLAAAIYYQPLFAKKRAESKSAQPMFVLDRNRLSSYVDDATQFDNRHTARMPTPEKLLALGVKDVLYVGPNAVDRFELDDLVDDFLAYAAANIGFHVCPAMAFEQASPGDAGAATPFWYGGSAQRNADFWNHWDSVAAVRTPNEVQVYKPKPRATPYSVGTPTSSTSAAPRPRPTNFGMVPVAVAVGTGVILGARGSRSGSWNRTTSPSTSS